MTKRPTPDLFLEQAALGERPRREEDEARLLELARSNQEILRSHPPRVVAAIVRSRAAGVGRNGWTWVSAGPLLAAAALAVAFLLPPSAPPLGNPTELPEEGIRLKGIDPTLHVHRVAGGSAAALSPEDLATAGDRLQLSYVAGEGRFGVVLSIDGRGSVTVHLPVQGHAAASLSPDGDTLLPESYALDDAPGFERFFLVTAAEPFAVAPVVTAAQALAQQPDARSDSLPLPSDLDQTSFLVLKR
jgi:hypothetical protein